MRKLSRKKLFLSGMFIGIVALASYLLFHKKQTTNEVLPISETVSTSGGNISVRVARTSAQQELGLSDIKSLPENQGMLFPFASSGIHQFWMKSMNFPLDMVWLKQVIKKNGQFGSYYQIISITQNATPESYPKTFQTASPVDAVLEINAYGSNRFGLEIGDIVRVF